MSIGTTHTQARYVLPEVIRAFRARYPGVQLHLHQGTSEQIAVLMERDQIDFAIATGSHELFPDTTLLPLYRWHRTVAVPVGHPLTREKKLTLKALAQFPIVTYSFSFSGPSSLNQVFAAAGLAPNVALTARDADVIKTYVRLGLGVGIVATVAIEPDADRDLVALDASHIFPTHTTWVGFRRGTLLRKYMYEFLHDLGGHLDRRSVDRARELPTPGEIERFFAGVELPLR